jgi:cytochrome P450
VALWHLLENPHLRQRMLVGSQEERYAILHEILRLEPIVGHLFRRALDVIEFQSEGKTHQIPAGALIDLNLFAANVDPQMAGDDSLAVCPARPLTSELGKVPEPVMSFGDGYHRCPGAYVAIQESDIFLQKLLKIENLRIERAPDMEFHHVVQGYEYRNFIVRVD